jgi:NAD-reducing hydrogenase large subunit
LAAANPEVARKGIRLRQFGQELIQELGGRKIHPAWAVPGGVRSGLTAEGRARLLAKIPEARETIKLAMSIFKGFLDDFADEVSNFGDFPSLFLGLVGKNGTWEHHDGTIRIVDSKGIIVQDGLDPSTYRDFIGEASEDHSYLKFPYYKPLGYPQGIYRVGPLARLNICTSVGVPEADRELVEFRQRYGTTPSSSFLNHYARMIEMTAAVEIVNNLLNDPEILSDHLRATAGINSLRGVGVSEAPRGTLFHDYTVDEDGLIQKVNLIIATGQNNLAMNKTIAQIAKAYIKGPDVKEGMLNRLEAGIRSFDPCLSCSTHAVGQMPMRVELVASDGSLVRELLRQ